MLKFCVPHKIKGKEKDALLRAILSVIQLGLTHEVCMHNGDVWYLDTDIVFERAFGSEVVPRYLKLLKNFLKELDTI